MPFDPKSKSKSEPMDGKEPVAAILMHLKGGGGGPPGADPSMPPGAAPSPEAGGPPGPGGDGTDQAQADLEHGASLLAKAVQAGNPQAIAQSFMAMFMVAQSVNPGGSDSDDTGGPPEEGE